MLLVNGKLAVNFLEKTNIVNIKRYQTIAFFR